MSAAKLVENCPTWCESKHDHESSHPEDLPLHHKLFGDPDGVGIFMWVMFYPDGRIKDSGFHYDIDSSSDPEDMEVVAGWCMASAAFLREVRGSMVTA